MDTEKQAIFRHDIKNHLMVIQGFAEILQDEEVLNDSMVLILNHSEKVLSVLNSGSFRIKNRMNVILGTLETILEKDDKNGIMIGKMILACQRIKFIIELIRVCEGLKKPRQFVLKQVVEDLKKSSEMEITFDESILVFEGDCLFPQTIMNLFQNSSFHGKATAVSVKTKKVLVKGKSFISIVIQDNGIGIPEQVKGKIFEKGITTRSTGKGGDGLYLVRNILKISGILIRETSKLGKPARFEILVPETNVICYKK